MRRSAWIFFASIFLPSLGLAWMAVRSVQDQQVVLEHQQVIISQNITDALAKSVQAQMDQVRDDFVKTTQQLLGESSSPVVLAQDFNRKIRDAWPMAEIGFAVNLDGQIYSPKPYDGPDAKSFRDENDRFLSNRENVEVYSSNSLVLNQNAPATKSATTSYAMKMPALAGHQSLDKLDSETQLRLDSFAAQKEKDAQSMSESQIQGLKQKTAPVASPTVQTDLEESATRRASAAAPMARGELTVAPSAAPPVNQPMSDTATLAPPAPAASDVAAASAPADANKSSPSTIQITGGVAPPATTTPSVTGVAHAGLPKTETTSTPPATDQSEYRAVKPVLQAPLPGAVTSPTLPAENAPAASATDEVETMPVPSQQATIPAPTSSIGGAEMIQKNISQSFAKIQRQVVPQQMLARDTASLSNTVPAESDFRRVIGTETSGALARFLEDKLRLMVWSHPAADSPIVFGAQIDQGKLVEALKTSLQIPELAQDSYSRSSEGAVCAAILDDTGHPVALSRPDFKGDWKHPFVATEIGEVLPHWEAALYLVDPGQISRAARTLRATLGLIVLLLVAAIVAGGSLIAADVRRQVRLAQQKTDFVSNVSHELKTPLTSIRMFADLLAEKRVPDEERQGTYLRIIAAEASRLTRLINNVLDFARLERGAPDGEHRACDLVEAVRDVVETCGPHLEAAGIAFHSEIEAESLPIRGDRDALAQIILNLVSNAEKYGGNDIHVRVRRQETAGGALGCVDVLDRGAGIPAAQAKTIFEPFHRLDDSLSSGIPGSGLGLTLARRMARAHGGDVTYSPRAGGGSCFTLTVPLEAVS